MFIKQAASLAGLNVASVQTDVDMASFHYGSKQGKNTNKTFALIDFGHSKTTISLAKYSSGDRQRNVTVVSTTVLPKLTGDLIDRTLIDIILENSGKSISFDRLDPVTQLQIRQSARSLKHKLTSNEEIEFTTEEIEGLGTIPGKYSRSLVAEKLEPQISEAKEHIKEFLHQNSVEIVPFYFCNSSRMT